MVGVIVITALLDLNTMAQGPGQFQPIAVIELFTSEGCSTCPPADKLLAATIKDANAGNKKIFGLAFHVDYWNRLGWRDSFSTKQFTSRQNMYVQALNLNGAYTPQIVVNGTAEIVGSDKAMLDKILSKALNTKSLAEFTGLKAVLNDSNLMLSYQLKGDFSNSHVNVALVSIREATAVKAGENKGSQLQHTNVVRKFVSAEALSAGSIELDNIPTVQSGNLMVIVYVQKNSSLQITGAASINPVR